MTRVDGVEMCGKRGGKVFLEQIRMRPYSRKCPKGLLPCSIDTTETETICVEPDQVNTECPILDFLVISRDQASEYGQKGYEISS